MEMLRKIGRSYHFRRKVPLVVRPFIGKQELWFSLDTSNRVTATARGGMIYGQVEAIFDDCRRMSKDEEYVRLLEVGLTEAESLIAEQEERLSILTKQNELRRFMEWLSLHDRFQSFIAEQANRIKQISQNLEKITHKQEVTQARLEESRESRSELTEALKQMASIASSMMQMAQNSQIAPVIQQQMVKPQNSPLLSEIAETYIETKRKDYKNDRDVRVLRNTFAMFMEVMGDKPVGEYTGRDAHEFIQTLRKLPRNYGKSCYYTPIRDSIAAADFKDTKGETIERMSEVTIEKRITFINGLWDFLLPIEHVQKNIWKGFKFKTETIRHVSDWSEENLIKLTNLRFVSKAVSRQTYAFITAIGAYSGMRQGEICHLRCEDFVHTDDGWVMYVQDHEPTEVAGKLVRFSPKTEAGERVVPVHPELIKVGLIKHVERMRSAGKTFIFHDLTPSGSMNHLSTKFQKAFSLHKQRAGVTDDTVFHSFRHSVSTILRNEDATIREVWIDSVLGHIGDSSKKSQGITTYLHKIGIKNLKKTINRIHYPETFQISKLFE